MLKLEEKRAILKAHLFKQGFFVYDGIKYGLDLLGYTDTPDKVHSKYGFIIFCNQTYQQLICLQRICNSNKKILIVVFISEDEVISLQQVDRIISLQEENQENL